MERVGAVLTEARAAGLQVRAEADRLVVRGPRDHEALARQLLEHKPAVLALLAAEESEVTWRVAAMRPQVPPHGSIPLLVARELLPAVGHCVSCGDALGEGRAVRCALCMRAAQIVLAGCSRLMWVSCRGSP